MKELQTWSEQSLDFTESLPIRLSGDPLPVLLDAADVLDFQKEKYIFDIRL